MIPKLLGRQPATKQFSWGRHECYVPGDDRFHTARQQAQSSSGDHADPGDWSVGVCRLACPCAAGPAGGAAPAPQGPYPACVDANVVLRHAGANAIFVDVSTDGSAGCWQNDCKNTDKFNAVDMGVCARSCARVDECTHWSYGEQEGQKKCFLRKADAGREQAEGWFSARKACAPPHVPDGFVARTAGRVLQVCDAGKSDTCPDMLAAMTTWKFAIRHLQKATEGKLDANTMNYVNQIATDTNSFASQMSEENFPVVAGNNRQVFNALDGWLAAQPSIPLDPSDASLPSPLRGRLCGPNSCYE